MTQSGLASRHTHQSKAAHALPARSSTAWSLFETDIGWVGIAGSESGVERTLIGYATAGDLVRAIELVASGSGTGGTDAVSSELFVEDDWCPELRARMVRYLAGEAVDFRDVSLAVTWNTAFQQAVVRELRQVPCGSTLSYQELAARAGSPKAARAVGQVMSSNPVPLIVPCHRVLGSGGRLGGFSAPTGLDLKRRLLDLESRSV